MNYLKQIIGIIICIGGVALIFVSNYIKHQVEEGKIKIESAERTVGTIDKTKSVLRLVPYGEEAGQVVQPNIDSANEKIAAGKKDVAYYEALASHLMTAGIIAIVVGLGIVFIPFGSKRKQR